VHVGDTRIPTLTRCNITSWPQAWGIPHTHDDQAVQTLATTVQTWPESLRDVGAGVRGFHGASWRAIPSSEGGDYSDPGDSPRGNSEDILCGPLGCILNFSGSGNLQGSVNTNVTVKGARFVFLDGDEAVLRDLDIRGASRSNDEFLTLAEEGGCLYASGNVAVTVADCVFSFCSSTVGGGAVCMYVCLYVCMCDLYVCSHVCIYVCMCMYVCICLSVCV
jgi:hypothetical protein